MNPYVERIYNGIVKENPVFIMMLGMCPALAVTTSATNGFGMGISTTVVLIMSNLIISLLRKVIPDQVRLPAYIVIVASLVTVVQLLIQAYIPVLYSALGIYIPLIVVNCIILGRAEAYAAKNPPLLSVMDGVGMGLGFTVGLTILGLLRELFGAGTAFGIQVMPDAYQPIAVLTQAPGAFLVLALIIAVMNAFSIKTAANDKVEGCDGCCATCQQKCADEKKEGETV
ncbi:MAG: electron transport complex subunit E [Clostridiales bacterium]|nr:electron transport complex subunit E [Clostridiales bacterium]